jgi:phosphatidylethanolamine-binding protein (PEBP) family uncharacterized protein
VRVDLDTMRNTSRKIFALSDVASLCAGSAEGQPTQNGETLSPPVAGTTGSAGTMSSAIIVEGAGVDRPEPVTHWIAYDLAAPGNRLREHQSTQARLDHGALQGLTMRKTTGFLGPKPPAGETHPLGRFCAEHTPQPRSRVGGTQRLVNAIKAHVVASGDVVVNFTGQ